MTVIQALGELLLVAYLVGASGGIGVALALIVDEIVRVVRR